MSASNSDEKGGPPRSKSKQDNISIAGMCTDYRNMASINLVPGAINNVIPVQ